MLIINYVCITSFSEDLKLVFADSTARLICKSQKTVPLLFQVRKCVQKAHECMEVKVSVQCTHA